MIKWLLLALLPLHCAHAGGPKDKDERDEKSAAPFTVTKYSYYKFGKTRSQSFYDYSNNNNHAVNGASTNSDNYDVCATTSGAYFYGNTNRFVDMPSNAYKTDSMFGTNNNIAVMAWIHFHLASATLLELQDGTIRELLMRWHVDAGKLKLTTFKGKTSNPPVVSSQTLHVDTWYFVGFAVSGSAAKFQANLYIKKSATDVYLTKGTPPRWEKSKKYIYFGTRYATTTTSWFLYEATIQDVLDNTYFLAGGKTDPVTGGAKPLPLISETCEVCAATSYCKNGGCNSSNVCLFGKLKPPAGTVPAGTPLCDESCSSCNGEMCKECSSYMMISPSKATCDCLPGYYYTSPTSGTYPNAVVDVDGKCTCADGYVLISGLCQCNLYSACAAPCKTCQNTPTECLSCLGEGATVNPLLGVGKCSCETGFYSYNNRCRPCPPECISCISANKCTGCADGYFSLGSTCVDSCPSYYYQDSGSCQACHPSCDTCTGSNIENCLTCSEPYFKSETGKCVSCPTGQFNTGFNYCAVCAADCLTCTTATACTKCADPLKKLDRRGQCKYPRCDKGFYRAGTACLPCHQTCKECETASTLCSKCQPNAHLNSLFDCDCNTGFIESVKICEPAPPVSASITAVSNTQLEMSFNDTMPVTLTAQDVHLSIPGLNFTWSVSREDNSTYSIELHFDKDNPPTKEQLAKLKLEFSKRLGGALNSQASNFAFVDTLPPAVQSSLSRDKGRKGNFAKNAKTIVRSSVSAALIGGWASGHLKSAWCLINTIQILLFIPMMDFALTQEVFDFLSAIMAYNFLPNLVAFMGYYGNTPNLQYAVDFGYDCDSVILNNGNTWIFLIYGLLAYPLYKYLSRVETKAIASYFLKKFQDLRFAYFVRTWIEMYLEIGITSAIKIASFDPNSVVNVSESVIAGGILVAIALSPVILAVFLLHNAPLIRKGDDSFEKTWGEWYGEFRPSKSAMPMLYYFLFFIRRLLYVLIIFLLHDYPTVQLVSCIVCSGLFLAYLVRFHPCEDRVDKMMQIIAEFGICVVFCMMNVFLYGLFTDLDRWSNIVIFTVLGIMGACLLGVLIQALLTMVAIYMQKKELKIVPTKEPDTGAMDASMETSMRPNVSYTGKGHVVPFFEGQSASIKKVNNFMSKR